MTVGRLTTKPLFWDRVNRPISVRTDFKVKKGCRKSVRKNSCFLPFQSQQNLLSTNLRSSKRSTSHVKTINTSDDNLHRDRNTLVVLDCLAEKLGLSSIIFFLNSIFITSSRIHKFINV
jgi:hypothetical protein